MSSPIERPSQSANSLEAVTMFIALPGSAMLAVVLIACAMMPNGEAVAALAVVSYATAAATALALRTGV